MKGKYNTKKNICLKNYFCIIKSIDLLLNVDEKNQVTINKHVSLKDNTL